MKECRKRSGNLINRKNTKFYIDAALQFFFQLLKKILSEKKSINFFWNPKKNRKSRNFERKFDFFEKKHKIN